MVGEEFQSKVLEYSRILSKVKNVKISKIYRLDTPLYKIC